MKTRRYTQGITLFTTPDMYQKVKRVSDEMEVSLSELFRSMIARYLESQHNNHQSGNDSENKKG
jgi:predicted house-cleaning NTP pyrophosphatase (Maf/HAM1 superfamily)